MMKWWGCTALFLLVLGCCTTAFAASFQIKPLSPVTSAVPAAVQPIMKTAVPVVAVTRVTAVNPRVLKLQTGDPAAQVSLAGSALDKATSAQLLKNNRPATGINVQLLGGSPGMRPVRISAMKSAAAGNYALRLMAGVTRVDVPLSTFSVQVAKAAQTPALKPMVGGVVGTAQPSMALQSAKTMPIKSAVTLKSPVAMKGGVQMPGVSGSSGINPMLLSETALSVQIPQAGRTFCIGEALPIRWTRDTTTLGPVNLNLQKITLGYEFEFAHAIADSGIYNWQVSPETFQPGQYRVSVQKTNSDVKAESGEFTVEECEITMIEAPLPPGEESDGSGLNATLTGEMAQGEVASGGSGQGGGPSLSNPILAQGELAPQSMGEAPTSEFEQQKLVFAGVEFKRQPRTGIIKYVDGKVTEASNGLSSPSENLVTVTDSILLGAQCSSGQVLRKLQIYTNGRYGDAKVWTGSHQSAQTQFVDFEVAGEGVLDNLCHEENVLRTRETVLSVFTELTCTGDEKPLGVNLVYPIQLTCDTRYTPAQRTLVNYMHSCPDGWVIKRTNLQQKMSEERDWNDPMTCVRENQ